MKISAEAKSLAKDLFDALNLGDGILEEFFAVRIQRAFDQQRETCAKICERHCLTPDDCAESIRATIESEDAK